ncbi:MAG: carboxylating nicotinate-nucleotide diphosphorylase [Gammaproteobacteria bacterium]|nr:carboxylating nicotinate-nucleotide diphosphorylase [Gammaproteobacteria bacterium]
MHWQETIKYDVKHALAEDIGDGDISAQLIDASRQLHTRLVVREDATLCGVAWVEETFRQCDESIAIEWFADDGDFVTADTVVCNISGPARPLLSAERTALNFLQTLSATATITKHYADLIRHTRCRVLDTRKTIPHLRLAQKYAVKCGGGLNHRIGLFDAFLVKENHLAACGSIATAVERARKLKPGVLLEVEVESLEEYRQAIDAQVDRVLLDNFSIEETRQAVEINHGSVQLEASGNITDQSLIAIAETGVDFISIGAITKHIRAIDFSLRYI